MKNIIYFLASVSLYFLSTHNCQAQYNPVNYDLYIQNDVNANTSDTAATTGNIIAVNTIFADGVGSYFATGTTLQDGFTVESGGILFLSVPIITIDEEGIFAPKVFGSEGKGIQMYPNPATNFTTISLTESAWNSNVRVEVYTLNSSVMVLSQDIPQKNAAQISLNTSALKKGIYVVKVYEGKGGKSFTRKLIKN